MLKSMTGFGKHSLSVANKKINLEIRTLNSKQFDINIRVPMNYKDKELDIRTLVSKYLIRGKIDVFINIEQDASNQAPTLNRELAGHYYSELKSLSENINQRDFENYLPIIAKLPEVFKVEDEAIDPKEWEQVYEGLEHTLQQVDNYRVVEGQQLEVDFKERIQEILALLKKVDPFEEARTDRIKDRIKTNLTNFLQDVNHDKNRLEQEMIYYIEKLDITEEKVRLLKHCEYFLNTLDSADSSGKKLGFICQEIGREINTLGSKANDADLQQVVVLMKDELEKIKEQLFNIL